MTPDIDRFVSQIESDIGSADISTSSDVWIRVELKPAGELPSDPIRLSLTEMITKTGGLRPQLAGELLPFYRDRLKGFAVSLLRSMSKVGEIEIAEVEIELDYKEPKLG